MEFTAKYIELFGDDLVLTKYTESFRDSLQFTAK